MRGFLTAATLAAVTVTKATTPPFNLAFAAAFSPSSPKQRHVHHASSSSTSPSTAATLSQSPPDVLCLGETLWDSLPSGMYLGGAPANVALHLASLFRAGQRGASVAVATCLGDDSLGREARRRLDSMGVRTEYAQVHAEWETDASYEFNTPAAWDALDMNEQLSDLILSHENTPKSTTIYVMGTIAARLPSEHGATSASTLTAIRNNAPRGSVVLDLNLRSPWYDPRSVLELTRGGGSSSSKDAKKLALLKLNEEELAILEGWCGFEAEDDDNGNGLTGSILKKRMEQLALAVNALRICVTRGEKGAALWCGATTDSNDAFHENDGYSMESSGDCDTVGAGDAFLAALVNSLFLLNEDPEEALARACALGGYVAGCRGATPSHGDAPLELRRIFQHTSVC